MGIYDDSAQMYDSALTYDQSGGYLFTPPLALTLPAFLPETKGVEWGLAKYRNVLYQGVTVYQLSDGSFVQDYGTTENSNTSIPPYPLSSDNATGTPNIIDITYTAASPGHPVTRIETDVSPYVVQVFYGGRTYTVSYATAQALIAYTAHGAGYSDCLTALPS